MVLKVLCFAVLAVSATCTIIRQTPLTLFLEVPRTESPNYSFAYDINNPKTGDIKSQQESRRGDVVVGQYSLMQPDGIQRTVDYRADDLQGFKATVHNTRENKPKANERPKNNEEEKKNENILDCPECRDYQIMERNNQDTGRNQERTSPHLLSGTYLIQPPLLAGLNPWL